MFSNKKSNEVTLTKELYDEILSKKKENIINLKLEQENHCSAITQKIALLKELKADLYVTKSRIKTYKRALKEEKRKLKRVNKSLDYHGCLINYLNNAFISAEDNIIDLSVFDEDPKQANKVKRKK